MVGRTNSDGCRPPQQMKLHLWSFPGVCKYGRAGASQQTSSWRLGYPCSSADERPSAYKHLAPVTAGDAFPVTNLLTDHLLCADAVAELSITSKFRKRMICVCSRSCSGVASVFFARSASRTDKTRKATSRLT